MDRQETEVLEKKIRETRKDIEECHSGSSFSFSWLMYDIGLHINIGANTMSVRIVKENYQIEFTQLGKDEKSFVNHCVGLVKLMERCKDATDSIALFKE